MTLLESIYNEPEKWRTGEYRFSHECGVAIWSANGLFFFCPVGQHISLLEKIRLFRAYRWWLKNAPVEAFAKRPG